MSIVGMDILTAMKDPRLLGGPFTKRRRLFGGGDTWFPWRAFLCALFALPFESEAAFQLYKACTGRTVAPKAEFRECFICAGRRSGKSFVCALVAIYCACFRDFSPYLSAGEVPVVAILAASRDQAGVLMKYCKAFLMESPVLSLLVVNEGKDFIELQNGVRIEILTSDFKTLRGRTVVVGLIDEQSHLDPSVDAELLNSLRPSQITVENSLLAGLSTPWRRAGSFFREVTENFGKDDSATLVWRASSRTMNNTISAASIALAFLRDEISARTEFNAEFRSDLETFISREAVMACVAQGVFERACIPRTSDYGSFVDVSGGKNDSSVLAIAHDENGISVLDAIYETQAPHSPEEAIKGYCETLKKWKVFEVTGDRYAASFVSDAFLRYGISYIPSELTRSQIYLCALPIVMSRQCVLLDNPRMISQLCGLERKSRANLDAVDHMPGAMDDVANASMGAIVLVSGRGNEFPVLDMAQPGGRLEQIAINLANAVKFVARDIWGKELPYSRNEKLRDKAYLMDRRQLGLENKPHNPASAAAWVEAPLAACSNPELRDEWDKTRCTGRMVPVGNAHRCFQCGYLDTGGVPAVPFAGFGGIAELPHPGSK